MFIIETDRLYIREFTLTDADFIFELMNTNEYIQNIGDRNIKTKSCAENFLADKLIKSYQLHGYGLFAIIRKEDDAIVGMNGFVNRETLPHTDIGFAFLPQFMGKGYGYESSRALMQYAELNLKLSPILGITSKTNVASQTLLKKIGLRYIKPITLDEEDEEIMLFSNQTEFSGE
ncbi:GNAT family N-acetyltransferase [Shewanella sp. 202IG2-18]|uniref:GNAT family N-acetyltransferase n=1 Tax=Parashewanella hymeniacidonis TaxID=2807618 RepID=UPI00195F51A9|nr:GNAT family N-acetyltransferase [Parashewanella hymeniacidonis]MBM7074064.1 GNAT family N-acetyltransferase [Parashewanella hymeniacidonis]